MGWGPKTTGAKPQPLPALDYEGPELSQAAASALNAKYAPGASDPDVMSKSRMKRLAAHAAEDDSVVVADPPSSTAKAEAAWGQFRSKKGWVPDTVAMILYEFVRERGLFDDLIAFAKKRK